MDVQVADGNGLALGTPDLRSVGPLAFGPDGILFVADNVSASIFAIAVEDAGDGAGPIEIDHLDTRLAALLGCARDDVVIRDLAIHPVSGAAYLSVMRGHGSDAVPLLVRAGQDGSLTEVPLADVAFGRTSIEDAPAEDDARVVLRLAEDGEPADEIEVRGIKLRVARDPMRSVTVTDLAYAGGTLLVAGASNEEFTSCLRRIPFPFGEALRSNSLEIFHVSHGKYETEAPVRNLVPYGGAGDVLASYTCTPVVHFSLAEAAPGAHVKGRTVAELGAMNTPLDMVSYRRDGQEYLLVANSRHPLFKLACADIDGQVGLTDQSGVGVPRQAVLLEGVVRMAVRGQDEVVMLQRDGDGNQHLRSYASDRL
jgi:hypothetical protein